jgi:hypothetical protein
VYRNDEGNGIMNDTKVHPMAEAKVQVRPFVSPPTGEWHDSLDFDPIMLPVELDGLTDAFSPVVISLMDAIIDADSAFSEHRTEAMFEYSVVWSESGHTVKAVCPVCDDVFPLAEGAPGDELNEGYDAVFCGCDPKDVDHGLDF